MDLIGTALLASDDVRVPIAEVAVALGVGTAGLAPARLLLCPTVLDDVANIAGLATTMSSTKRRYTMLSMSIPDHPWQ